MLYLIFKAFFVQGTCRSGSVPTFRAISSKSLADTGLSAPLFTTSVVSSTTSSPTSTSSSSPIPSITSTVAIVYEKDSFGSYQFWDAWAYSASWSTDWCAGSGQVLSTTASDVGSGPTPTIPAGQTFILGDLPGGQKACQYVQDSSGLFECGSGLPHVVTCQNSGVDPSTISRVNCDDPK